MNNSGICIRELIEYFKIDSGDVIVFHDDMDVDFMKQMELLIVIMEMLTVIV